MRCNVSLLHLSRNQYIKIIRAVIYFIAEVHKLLCKKSHKMQGSRIEFSQMYNSCQKCNFSIAFISESHRVSKLIRQAPSVGTAMFSYCMCSGNQVSKNIEAAISRITLISENHLY